MSFVRKLFVYDHCPYCTRVRVVAGAKKIPLEIKFLLFDDEKAHIDLCGKKAVPILEYEPGKYMLESLDIVKLLDALPEYGAMLAPQSEALKPALNFPDGLHRQLWLTITKMPLGEFGRQSAIDYYIEKKLASSKMSLDQIKAALPQYAIDVNNHMQQVSKLLPSVQQLHASNYAANGKELSYDDVILWPFLRVSTAIKGLVVPENVKLYTDHNAKRFNLSLFYQHAS